MKVFHTDRLGSRGTGNLRKIQRAKDALTKASE